MGRKRLEWYKILLPIFKKCNSQPIQLPDELEISQKTSIMYKCSCGVECTKLSDSIRTSQSAKCYNCEMFRTNETFIEPTRSSYCIALIYTLLGKEIWKQMKHYPNYDVSNFGNYCHFRKNIRPTFVRNSGYVGASVTNSDTDKRRGFDNSPKGDIIYIHSAVCKTFIPNIDYTTNMTIDHINRDKTCNNLLNLIFKTKVGQRANQEYPDKNSTNRPIWKCDIHGNRLEKFEGAKEAGTKCMNTLIHNYKNMHTLRASINHACKIPNTIVAGYKWVYDQDINITLPGELWVTVPQHVLHNTVNEYEVSNLGRIRRKKDTVIILGSICANGYRVYTFRQKQQQSTSKRTPAKTVKGHRIVALTFLANPDNKPVVDHINENKQDNRVENLRWVTHKENKEAHEIFSNRNWTTCEKEQFLESIKTTPKDPRNQIKWKEYVIPDLLKKRTIGSIRSKYTEMCIVSRVYHDCD